MDIKQIRKLILKYLRTNKGDFQVVEIQNGVKHLAGKKQLDPGDLLKINDVLWTLNIQGLILPGIDDYNLKWPFLHLTEYGRKCLDRDAILPHDPDSYLKDLKKSIPDIDPLILLYITESLQSFLRGNYLSSTVMLGVASEQAFLLLFAAFKSALSNERERQNLERVERKPIKVQFEEFLKRFNTKTNQLPSDLVNNIDVFLNGIFTWIRVFRNDVGHPTGRIIEQSEAFANLHLFAPYLKHIYSLINYFLSKPTSIQ